MNKYLVAYYNWADNLIQFTEVEADTGFLAMKEIETSPTLDKIKDEEQYCQASIARGGFIGYLQI